MSGISLRSELFILSFFIGFPDVIGRRGHNQLDCLAWNRGDQIHAISIEENCRGIRVKFRKNFHVSKGNPHWPKSNLEKRFPATFSVSSSLRHEKSACRDIGNSANQKIDASSVPVIGFELRETMSDSQTPQKLEVTIYTDGACVPNPGPGGWACILVSGAHRKELSGFVPAPTTNNRCEMGAIIEAVRSLKKPCKVKLVTDSMVCVYALRGRNRKPRKRKNPDLVEKMLGAAGGHELTIEHVHGHAGHLENERCDQLAGEALQARRNPTPEYTMPVAGQNMAVSAEMPLFGTI